MEDLFRFACGFGFGGSVPPGALEGILKVMSQMLAEIVTRMVATQQREETGEVSPRSVR